MQVASWNHRKAKLKRNSGDQMGNAASAAPESTAGDFGSGLLQAGQQHPPRRGARLGQVPRARRAREA